MGSDNEYEVESITMARFVKGTGRQERLFWEYNVKWKGYDATDNTWEPIESFRKSEHLIKNFWQRVDTKGRDYKNTRLFKVNEEYFPSVRKTKQKFPNRFVPEDTRKQCGSPDENSAQVRPCKRPREGFTPFRGTSSNGKRTKVTAKGSHLDVDDPSSFRSELDPVENSFANEPDPFAEWHNQLRSIGIPLHRAQVTNPRVKLLDAPNIANMQDAISVKARLMSKNNSSSANSASQPLKASKASDPAVGSRKKNTSSLLTAERGQLKTVKGRYQHPSMEVGRATGPDLLSLAGVEQDVCDSLADFEDNDYQSIFEANVKLAELDLEQSVQSQLSEMGINRDEKTSSTLCAVTSQHSQPDTKSSSAKEKLFLLQLDASIQLPALLTNGNFDPQLLQDIAESRSPPGKYYDQELTLAVLDTFRTTGSVAKVALSVTATDEQKQHFETLRSRLEIGGLFISMVNDIMLVFCSSSNDLICQRLHMLPSLKRQSGKVLVTRVIIENYSDFARAELERASKSKC